MTFRALVLAYLHDDDARRSPWSGLLVQSLRSRSPWQMRQRRAEAPYAADVPTLHARRRPRRALHRRSLNATANQWILGKSSESSLTIVYTGGVARGLDGAG
jgi:hypothetical protein